jgi:OOP family OmpA-OmpF porin
LLKPVFILFLSYFAFAEASLAQERSGNLVPNGSFENLRTECPDGLRQIFKTKNWESFGKGSPDLFVKCELDSVRLLKNPYGYKAISVPKSGQGFQFAKTGKAYAGLILHEDRAAFEEFLRVKLSRKLRKGEKVTASFYVNLAEISGFAINGLGMAVVDSSVSSIEAKDFKIVPQAKNNEIISDTANWVLISHEFIAKGGEQYAVIGGFNPLKSRKVIQNKQSWFEDSFIVKPATYAYYFIDEVSVIGEKLPVKESKDLMADGSLRRSTSKSSTTTLSIPNSKVLQKGKTLITLYFDFDKSTLNESEIQRFRDFFSLIDLGQGAKFTLAGHTDVKGSNDYNQKLSARRNSTVKQLLMVALAIPAEDISVQPFGESLRFSKIDKENRRVQIQWAQPED